MRPDNPYNLPSYLGPAYGRKMLRDERILALTSANQQILGPNPRRVGVILGFDQPNGNDTIDAGVYVHAADGTTPGNKLTLTAATGFYTVVTGWSIYSTSAHDYFIEHDRGAAFFLTYAKTGIASELVSVNVPLLEGDNWILGLSAGAVGTIDASIFAYQTPWQSSAIVTTHGQGASDQGFTILSGQQPFYLWRELIGDSLTEGLWARTKDSVNSNTLSIIDLYT